MPELRPYLESLYRRKEGRKQMECTRQQLEHEDLEALYLDFMRGNNQPEQNVETAP